MHNLWNSIQKSVTDYARWIEMAREEPPQYIPARAGIIIWASQSQQKVPVLERTIGAGVTIVIKLSGFL